MADKNCYYCTISATTERIRANDLSPLALCRRCADVWDQVVAAAIAEPKPVDDQVRTLFEAVRFLVHNMLPQYISSHTRQRKLVKELDAVIGPGGKRTVDDLLAEHPNLHTAVSVLIESAKTNHDSDALYRWDQIRKQEVS